MKRSNRRSERGSTIIMGAAGMMLITAMLLAAVLFILNLSLIGNYQNKLDFVARQAAKFANYDLCSSSLEDDTAKFVEEALSYSGLPYRSVAVSTKSIRGTNGSSSGIQVTVSAALPLLGKDSWLPDQVRLTSCQKVPGFVAYLRVPGMGGSSYDCYVPVVSKSAASFHSFLEDIGSLVGNQFSSNSTTMNNMPVFPEQDGYSWAQNGALNGNWISWICPQH
jgi:hypothetical protein